MKRCVPMTFPRPGEDNLGGWWIFHRRAAVRRGPASQRGGFSAREPAGAPAHRPAPPEAGPPGRADVLAAAEWLSGRVVRTPLVRSRALDEHAGVRLWLKAENLQHGGSYKFSGAMRAAGRPAAP